MMLLITIIKGSPYLMAYKNCIMTSDEKSIVNSCANIHVHFAQLVFVFDCKTFMPQNSIKINQSHIVAPMLRMTGDECVSNMFILAVADGGLMSLD